MDDIFERGKGKVKFTKNDFASSGGEAKVYKKGNICYKVFHTPKKMIPEGKIGELQTLDMPNIIKPLSILLNKNNTPIGFTSAWVDGLPLCKVFVTGFRKRNGITDDHAVELVKNMCKTTHFIHSKKCVIVDGNEMNYLVGQDFITPYFIDVNSWKTPSYPATALMDSVKDWEHPDVYTPESDWFAFAIISCWIFVGIHPFRGNHPDYKDKDLHVKTMKRTLDRVSIFNPDVLLAPNARLSSIPKHYKDWYLRVFEKGERSMPPLEAGMIVAVPIDVTVIKGTDKFEIKEMKKYRDEIIWYARVEGRHVIKTMSGIRIDNKEYSSHKDANVVFSEKKQVPIFSVVDKTVGSELKFTSISADIRKTTPPRASEIMVVGNHLYYRNRGSLVEMSMHDHPSLNRVIPAMKHDWQIMPNSSTLFAGVVFQNMLGVPYISIPLPKSDKNSSFITKKIPELDGHKIMDAKHDNHVVTLFTSCKGDYKIIVLRFDKEYNKYDCREIICSDVGDINMTTLDNGVCIMIPENGILEVFGNKPFVNDVKSIHDPVIETDMRLCKNGTTAMFHKGKSLYTIKMK